MRPKTAKSKSSNNEYGKEIQFLQQQKLVAYGGDVSNLPQIYTKNPAFLVLETEIQAELFNARCHDTGETVSMERAKVFKEEYNKLNSKKHPEVLTLNSMRLGVTTVLALANLKLSVTHINLADNLIGDYAIHALKQLLNNSQISGLNLASNMISHAGLGSIIDELTKNQQLKFLDLGVLEGSIRKNSLGLEGAKYITQLILANKVLETLKLQDNDFTSQGGEIIGTALKSNTSIKHFKIAENDLKNQGIEQILEYGLMLESLDISKNGIKSTAKFQSYLQNNLNLRKLNLEYNDLGARGVEYIAQGLIYQQSGLITLNLRGNQIGDEGLQILAQAITESESLQELDIALNDITPQGIFYLAEVLPDSQLKVLNISKNLLGDESLIMLSNNRILEKLDVSSSRVSDQGILHFLEFIAEQQNFASLRANDNFISEKIEKVLLEIVEKNKYIQDLTLSGNRLSLCCLNRVTKLLQRNQKLLEDKEPTKIRTEIYRLKYEQKKIMIAKEKLQVQEKEIMTIEEQKHKVVAEMERIKQLEQGKRQQFQDRILEHQNLIEKKKKIIEDKVQEFDRNRIIKQMEIDELKKEYEATFQRRKEFESEYERLQQELDNQEIRYKDEAAKLEESIADKKRRTEEVEQKTAALRDELSKLTKPQVQEPQQQQQQQQQQQVKDGRKESRKGVPNQGENNQEDPVIANQEENQAKPPKKATKTTKKGTKKK